MRTRVLRLVAWATLTAAMSAAQAQLPPEVEADRLLQRAAAEMEKAPKDQSAIVIVRSLEAALATGTRMPTNFAYHLGRALTRLGDSEEAVRWLERYLKEQGTEARYYKEALSTYSTAQKSLPSWHGFHERFEWYDKTAGELRDRKTGLIWQACNSGSTGQWEGRWCSGYGQPVNLTWDATMAHATDMARRTGQPWRVPSPSELREVAAYLPYGLTGSWTWTNRESGSDKAFVVIEHQALEQRLGETMSEETISKSTYKSMDIGFRLVR